MTNKKTMSKAKVNRITAGLVTGSDQVVAEASREVDSEHPDRAALLFSKAVSARAVSRFQYARWFYQLSPSDREMFKCMATVVRRRLEMPERFTPAKVVRAYHQQRVPNARAVRSVV